ncbi:hypothetical protein LTR97_000462 [Elasticomyces elasticus]|uniref:Uncharacterized protein n=1 Tax=Elasticomyces elasticus TaxID=574655 RepID=A0AAN7WHD0_9PEZI|nr:hypothetical protein LTR97_000462 [Elasticomyces elasticus]
MAAPLRPQHPRAPTWPPSTTPVTSDDLAAAKSKASLLCATTNTEPANKQFFDADDEDHPEDHFLSAYEYDDWANSDDDDDEEEIEWDAGIIDFALFDDDRRQAEEKHEQLGHRWRGFMSNQHLRDDLDVEELDGQPAARVPSYLTITLTPPSPKERMVTEDDDLPLFFDALKLNSRAPQRHQRPGLRHARTMSGKLHSWRRPSWRIHSVGEEPDAEREAEMDMAG